jgi:hypothetical protein
MERTAGSAGSAYQSQADSDFEFDNNVKFILTGIGGPIGHAKAGERTVAALWGMKAA